MARKYIRTLDPGGPIRTYKEVGELMGISDKRVEHIERAALKKLRHLMATMNLEAEDVLQPQERVGFGCEAMR